MSKQKKQLENSLLSFKPIPIPSQSREFNVDNGNDAEIFSASLLLKAMGAEISWGSRNEDGRKIDLICSYDHPWIGKERLIFFVQVKSGPTYGKISGKGFELLSAAKKAAIRTSHPICIVWVCRTTNATFWAYMHTFSTLENQIYGENHLVNPGMRFDVARCQAQIIPGRQGGNGIIVKKSVPDLQSARLFAERLYKSFKTKDTICPNFGKVEFTRIGWRHMFRHSRSAKIKQKSLDIIPYLDKILMQKPTTVYISKNSLKTQSDHFDYRTIEYVLSYDMVKIYNNEFGTEESIKVIVRLIEEIRWPNDWRNQSMLNQQIERRLVLLSAYYK